MNILPLPRQKIYKIYFLDFIKDIFLLNFKHGKKVATLEREILNITNSKYGLALNRGRLGAYLAVKSVISNKKNKIILSPFTIFDVVNMVICAGGVPVFVDINRETITIDYENILKSFDDQVAAILLTHTYAVNKDIEKIINFSKKNKISIIEDCAISFGTQYKNSYIGTLGDIGFYSFGMFKFVSSLNGGFIITKDKEIFTKIIEMHNKFNEPNFFQLFKNFLKAIFISFFTSNIIFKFITNNIIRFGYLNNINIINNFTKNDPEVRFLERLPDNYKVKISNSQANSIIKQLHKFKDNLNIRIGNAYIYYKNLKNIKELIIPPFNNDLSNGYLNFPIQFNNRNKLLKFLFINKRDVAKYFYRNCNLLEIFKKYRKNIPLVEKVVNEIIILPTYPSYKKKQIYKNIELIKEYFKKN